MPRCSATWPATRRWRPSGGLRSDQGALRDARREGVRPASAADERRVLHDRCLGAPRRGRPPAGGDPPADSDLIKEHFGTRDEKEFDRLPLLTNAGFYMIDASVLRDVAGHPQVATLRRTPI